MSQATERTASGTRSDLTELEACVLGVIAHRAPCTAYAVRAVFASSPTRRWSGSAGAIYPLVRRLHAKGWLSQQERPRGTRTSRYFSVTPVGLRAIQAWLAAPVEDDVLSIPVDPVRTRLHFIDLLPVRDRRRWARTVYAGLERQARALREEWDADAFPSDLDRLAARGTLDLIEARLAWFETVRAFLEE